MLGAHGRFGGPSCASPKAFGETMSDEFVDVMLGKLVVALRPNSFDRLDELTLNVGLPFPASPVSQLPCTAEAAPECRFPGIVRGGRHGLGRSGGRLRRPSRPRGQNHLKTAAGAIAPSNQPVPVVLDLGQPAAPTAGLRPNNRVRRPPAETEPTSSSRRRHRKSVSRAGSTVAARCITQSCNNGP
jgi:hypothetical protein